MWMYPRSPTLAYPPPIGRRRLLQALRAQESGPMSETETELGGLADAGPSSLQQVAQRTGSSEPTLRYYGATVYAVEAYQYVEASPPEPSDAIHISEA